MTATRHGRTTAVLEEIEMLAKRLRAEMRRAAREAGITKNLMRAAAALRKQAALAAAQVERFAREVRIELAQAPAKRRTPIRRKGARAA